MNIIDLMDELPLWGVLLTTVITITLSIEFGFYLGKRARTRNSGTGKIH